jgi:hypothetical protein
MMIVFSDKKGGIIVLKKFLKGIIFEENYFDRERISRSLKYYSFN